MHKVTLPKAPERRSADYQLDGFEPARYARVVYTPQEQKSNYITIEAQAFEVDESGNFCSAPNGSPSRTPGSNHQLLLTGIGDTHSLVPAWVRVAGDYNDDNLPDGTSVLEQMPELGVEGARIWVDQKLFTWSEGMIETVLRGKAKELAGILTNSNAIDFARL